MASMFGASIFSPSSSLPAYQQQYGSRSSCYPAQRFPSLKVNDNSNVLSLTVKAQVAFTVASVNETLEKTELSTSSETLDPSASGLLHRRPHLSPLINELSEGADVSSSMTPWLEKLTIWDWNDLVRHFGDKDGNISWQIVFFFREKADLLDGSVLWLKHNESEGSRDAEEDSEEEEEPDKGEASQSPLSKAVTEAGSIDASSVTKGESKSDWEDKPQAIRLLYRTLAKVLAKNKNFDKLEELREQIENDSVKPNFTTYNLLVNFYTAEGLTEKVSEIVSKMEAAGFEPTKFAYEQIAYLHMKGESPNLDAAANIMKSLMEKGHDVTVGIFKNLLKAYWRTKNVAGAELVFQAMQEAGNTPDLKDLQKMMYCHKQTGNYERILELMEMMDKWGIQPNVGVYDHLLYAYCKAGSLEKAKETLLQYESVLGQRPSLVALNILVNAYGKKGLQEEALLIFEKIWQYKYRPNSVSYASIIFAMAQAGDMNTAARLYRRMVRQGIEPQSHTYMALIRAYTKLDWTREGRKISQHMRRSPFPLTPEAYGVILILFVEGNWYSRAAAILKEMEEGSVELDCAASASLIRSFSKVGSELTPLSKAIEESSVEVCKLLTVLFIKKGDDTLPDAEAEEAVLSFLEKLADQDEGQKLLYNAFMECFWRRGLKSLSRRLLSSARQVYAERAQPQWLASEWVLDVRGLSVGGAKVAVTEWLIDEGEGQEEEKPKDDAKWVLITGNDSQLHVIQDNRVLKRALSSMLKDLGSPFVESPDDLERLEAMAPELLKWVLSDKVKEVLNFTDADSPQ